MYKNILLAYDFENSFTNVPKAIENLSGGQNDATVTIYNVISDAELQSSRVL
jgi:universal stress protein G